MAHQKNAMTQEEAQFVQKGDIIFYYDDPWVVTDITKEPPDKYCTQKPALWFKMRLGRQGYGGHEHWGHFSSGYSLKPCCKEYTGFNRKQ